MIQKHANRTPRDTHARRGEVTSWYKNHLFVPAVLLPLFTSVLPFPDIVFSTSLFFPAPLKTFSTSLPYQSATTQTVNSSDGLLIVLLWMHWGGDSCGLAVALFERVCMNRHHAISTDNIYNTPLTYSKVAFASVLHHTCCCYRDDEILLDRTF